MSREPTRDPPNGLTQWGMWHALGVWLLILVALFTLSRFLPDTGAKSIAYSEIKSMIHEGAVEEALLDQHSILVRLRKMTGSQVSMYRAVTLTQGDPELLALLESKNVKITAREPQGVSVLIQILPWVLLFAFIFWLQRRMFGRWGGGFNPRDIGDLWSGRFSIPNKQKTRIKFEDVAGQDQAKKEVAELVDFLREPERFQRVGAEVPHGVLLMGAPGTGKTLLAKALAGEADVPFFSTTGSEFIEVFVGVGAGRVRKMFEAARNTAPSVIFIDELDSIGRTRGTGLGGGHDEREQTLNQILAEMDGFSEKEAVVVLAATNRPDVLDPALLRPGRFDRHVMLNLPDKKARRAILDIHARRLPLANIDDLDAVAATTPGFSGADLKNLLNEAAIEAARRYGDRISMHDLQEARDKVTMGTVRTLAIQPEERHRLAVHEAGHAVVAYFTPGADPLYKVTIIPRGRSLGGTHTLSREEHHTLSEDYLGGQLVILLAGRAAEKLLIGTVSSGADDDIRRATELARSMVTRWGMSKEIGVIDLRQHEDHPFLGRAIAQPRNHSDETAAKVDRAVMDMLDKAEETAKTIIAEHEDETLQLLRKLESEEVLDLKQIQACLDPQASRSFL